MKNKTIVTILFLLAVATSSFAQPKPAKARSIISASASIKTYNERKSLEGMLKGELIELYKERIKILVSILPNIALATKPGISLTDLGIPDTPENKKALDDQILSTNEFLTNTIDFQTKMLPFSDKVNIINCILFYESTLKQLNVINDTE
jgi:hypothetical protein